MTPQLDSWGVLFWAFFNQFLAVSLRKHIFATLSEKSKDGEVGERLKPVVC